MSQANRTSLRSIRAHLHTESLMSRRIAGLSRVPVEHIWQSVVRLAPQVGVFDVQREEQQLGTTGEIHVPLVNE